MYGPVYISSLLKSEMNCGKAGIKTVTSLNSVAYCLRYAMFKV